MKVYVINKHGRPLMPTTPRKARLLLKEGKAKIVGRSPFTIQLVHGSSGYVQPATLGIDAGYQNIGFSAVNSKEELIGGELNMLEGMSERITEKRKYRRVRRNRKRHHKPRFDNRRRNDDWLAPSIHHKLDTHHRLINRIKAILPISRVVIEVASFDIQKLKNPNIEGEDYQQGEQYGFYNLREYILHRDGHQCQNPDCKNKSPQLILEIHHLGFWKNPPDRTDRPGNLITLCLRCHTPKNHKPTGFLHGWEPKLKPCRGETFMSTVRWRLTLSNSVKGEGEHLSHHRDVESHNLSSKKGSPSPKETSVEGAYEATYGYITKAERTALELPKSHHNDAFVIAGGKSQNRCEPLILEQIRRHKRSLEQFYDAQYLDTRDKKKKTGTILCSGRRTRNKNISGENLRVFRGHKLSKGRRAIKKKRYPYKQYDVVLFVGKTYEVVGMQNLGTRLSLKPDVGCSTKYKTAALNKVKPLRRRGGICG